MNVKTIHPSVMKMQFVTIQQVRTTVPATKDIMEMVLPVVVSENVVTVKINSIWKYCPCDIKNKAYVL